MRSKSIIPKGTETEIAFAVNSHLTKRYRASKTLGTGGKQLLLMTGAGHRAVLAVAAAAYHRLTLLFLFDHADDDRRDDRDQHRTDNDRADVIRYPCKHTFNSFYLCDVIPTGRNRKGIATPPCGGSQ